PYMCSDIQTFIHIPMARSDVSGGGGGAGVRQGSVGGGGGGVVSRGLTCDSTRICVPCPAAGPGASSGITHSDDSDSDTDGVDGGGGGDSITVVGGLDEAVVSDVDVGSAGADASCPGPALSRSVRRRRAVPLSAEARRALASLFAWGSFHL